MKDRAHQALVKLALEPAWESKFEAHSYGFRERHAPVMMLSRRSTSSSITRPSMSWMPT
jgi:hypothetical protein